MASPSRPKWDPIKEIKLKDLGKGKWEGNPRIDWIDKVEDGVLPKRG